jgi:hypothetical protein
VAALLLGGLALAGCGDATGPGARGAPGIRLAAGFAATDTAEAAPDQALVVEVRGRDGRPAVGVPVTYTSVGSAPVVPCRVAGACRWWDVADTTDATGRSRVLVRFGTAAGTARLRVAVPDLAFADTAEYTILPGRPAKVAFDVRDTLLLAGREMLLRATITDRSGNPRPDRPALAGTGPAADVDPTTGRVTARAMGTSWVVARLGAVADSARVRVVPAGRLVGWTGDEIVLTHLDGSGYRRVAGGVYGWVHGTFPRFAIGGGRITWSVPYHMADADTAGGPVRTTEEPAFGTQIIGARLLAGGALYFVAYCVDWTGGAAGALYRGTPGGAATAIAPVPDIADSYGGVDISGDGRRVAYVARGGGADGLRVLDVASGAWTLIDPAGGAPRWSPAGDRLAYLRVSATGNGLDGALTIVNADGSGARAVSARLFNPGVAWSPDGAYLVGRAVERQALVVRVTDGESVALPFDNLYQPDWR